MTTNNIKMAKEKVEQTKSAQEKYQKNVKVVFTDKYPKQYRKGDEKGKEVTAAVAANGIKLGWFKK